MAEMISTSAEDVESKIQSDGIAGTAGTTHESELAGIRNDQGHLRRRSARTSSPAETFRDRRRVRCKDKLDTGQLPTPPPDPITTGNIFEEAFTKHKAHLEAEALRKEGEFLDYLIGLPTPSEAHTPSFSRSTSAFTESLGTDAFDHLDRLYILMEQVLNLREQNSKLSRRVRELERLRALKSAHREAERAVLTGQDSILSEEDAGFAESLLGAMLSAGTDVSTRRNFRPPLSRQRSRSIGVDAPVLLSSENNRYYGNLSSAKRRVSDMNGSPKVSKWTKVKAAFKWERAYTGGTGESEIAKHLKIPENMETAGNASSSSGSRMVELSAPPTPDTLSSASSIDDISHGVRKSASNHSSHLSSQVKEDTTDDDPTRRSRSLDGDVSTIHSSMFSTHTTKDNANHRKPDKGHKTPWGKVKDMIYLRRESLRRQPARSSIRSEDGYSISSLESSEILQELQGECGRPRIQITSESPTLSLKPSSPESDVVDLATRRLTPTLTITVPSNEELRSISSPESISPPPMILSDSAEERSPSEELETSKNVQTSANLPPTYPQFAVARSRTCQDVCSSVEFKRQRSGKADSLASSPKMQRHDSKWNKVKKAFLTNTNSVPPSPSKITSFFDDTDGLESYSASAEDLENDPTNPNIQAEIQRNYQLLHDKLSAEFYRKLSEWEKLKSASQTGSQPAGSHDFSFRPWSSARERDSMNLQMLGEEQLTPEFKKKLQEWKRMKKDPHSPTISEHQAGRKRITDWQLWRSSSKPETKSEAEHNKPHLSEDFIKKMEEWKRIKAYRIDDDQQESGTSVGGSTAKQSKGWKTPEEKELQSLERDLSKVERQREKFLDREARLSMLRRVVGSSPQKKEVLVHTSTGYYRFEGISRKFTRKLYEWEKSQGISPELSTFRLLNPSYRNPTEVTSINTIHERGSRQALKRSKSVGSMVEGSTKSETPIRQPSSLSLNDMEELEAECMAGDSQLGSEPTIAEETTDDIVLDDSEPEAMIVDIEDVIEETASPMVELQPHQTPIYSVAASETTSIAVPLGTVTASHEPSPVILMEAGEIHPMTTRVTVRESRNENLTLSLDIKNAGTDVTNESPSGSSGSKRDWTQFIDSEWKQDYLRVLNEMQRNEKKLRELEAEGIGVEASLHEASNVERFTERQDSLGEIVGLRQMETRGRDVLVTTEKKIKESFASTLQRQTDLCRQLLKKTPQLEEFDSKKATQLLRWLKELASTLIRRYNEDLQHKETSSSLDNTGAFCSIGEKDTPGISAGHRQRAEKLLTTIRDAAVEMFEPKEDRSSPNDSKSQMINLTAPRTPKKRTGQTADSKDSEESTRNNIRRIKRSSESEQTCTNERSSSIDRIAATSARKRSNVRRQSSTDDDETMISIDKDIRQKTIVQTKRHTDTQTTGYKWPSSEEPEDPDNGHVYSEPTFRTVPLTVAIFRDSPDVEKIIINENTLNKIVVRTVNTVNTAETKAPQETSSNRSSGNYSDSTDLPAKKEKNGPRSVFVKTKRIIFSPFRRDSKGKALGSNNVDVESDGIKTQAGVTNVSNHSTNNTDQLAIESAHSLKGNDGSKSESPRMRNRSKHDSVLRVCEVIGRPPLPQSPVLARKEYHKSSPKETAPSIRMMIQRYNQKLENATGSPASSESGSPIWRSPSSERRVRTQTERYQEEVRKAITGSLQVQKSASTSVIGNDLAMSSVQLSGTSGTGCSGQVREISKSTSADFIGGGSSLLKRAVAGTCDDTKNGVSRSEKLSPGLVHKLTALSSAVAQREGRCSIASSSTERSSSFRSVRDTNGVRLEESADQSPLKLRALKIQRAKEDFLSGRGPRCYSNDPQIDRLEDVGSKSRMESLDAGILRSDLVKSASAGMINVDPDTYERLSLNRGCESLPRPAKRRGESSGRFSQIASKFRRARMRRAKDKDGKMSTVSMLCRQSLLVDIQSDETSKSCPSTPALQRDDDDYSWLKKSRDGS